MRTAPPIPKPPTEASARLVIALAIVLPPVALLLGTGTFSVATAAGIFLSCGWLGIRRLALGRAVQRTHAALQAITRGNLDEAEAHLEAIPRRWSRSGALRRSVVFQRALIAFYRADFRACVALVSSAVDARRHFSTLGHEKMQDALSRALRALANASLGENDRVAEDVAQVVGSPYATADALARIRLAEAVVLSRRGDDAGLAEHMRGHASIMLEHAAPRERVLGRALKKMAQVRARSIYREPGKRSDEAPADPLGPWLAQIAPEAAPYADPRAPLADRVEVAPIAAPTPEANLAIARSRALAKKRASSQLPRLLALWGGLVVMFLAFFQLLSPTEIHRPGHPVRTVPPDTSLVATMVLLVIAIFVALLWRRVGYARRAERDVLAAHLALATGDVAGAEPSLQRLARIRSGLGLAQALRLRAQHAEKLGRFEESLAMASDALASVGAQLHGIRTLAALSLTPTILGQRAVALAALGREPEANAELATLSTSHAVFAYRAVIEHRVRLIAAARRGDLDAARAVARERSRELTIPLRDEVLGDLVMALAPSGASAEEQARVDAELRESAELRAWVDAIAPGLADELARRAGASLRIADAVHEDSEEAPGLDHAVSGLAP